MVVSVVERIPYMTRLPLWMEVGPSQSRSLLSLHPRGSITW